MIHMIPMRKKHRLGLVLVALLTTVIAGATLVVSFSDKSVVLHPKGEIAQQQFDLIMFTTLLSLLVVVPVFTLTFYIVWKYRESNTKTKKKYRPDWDGHRGLEATWWLIPLAIISVLAVVTWQSSHKLDPYKPLASDAKPVTIKVIALQWKWLFIYPEQNIASVNQVQFPVDRPVNFEITADAPMNSFWIPQLGGQVYAMAGMQTKLHLMADHVGDYRGSSANISGEGFASMKFTAQARTQVDFDQWVKTAKRSRGQLTMEAYDTLAKPTRDVPPVTYAAADNRLYDTVMMKYMMPGHDHDRASMQNVRGSEDGSPY